MATTFLTHSCGGPVVLDASQSIKFIAPSFSVGMNGITKVTLDISVVSAGKINPAFSCEKCKQDVQLDTIGATTTVMCQVCGNARHTSEINVHSHIPAICDRCLDAIKEADDDAPGYIRRAIIVFGLTKRIRTVKLTDVLASPISL